MNNLYVWIWWSFYYYCRICGGYLLNVYWILGKRLVWGCYVGIEWYEFFINEYNVGKVIERGGYC